MELNTPAFLVGGVARLESRVRVAAESLCGGTNFRDLAGRSLENACVVRIARLRPNP